MTAAPITGGQDGGVTASGDLDRTIMAAALRLAFAGIAVFPARVSIVKGRKEIRPIAAWRHASSTDPDAVRAWFAPGGRWAGASLCVDVGKSGLVVIDPDGADGVAAWRELVARHRMRETWRSATPGGGQHWIYAADPDRPVYNDQAGRLAPHVDVRGDGGFVIVPPSRDDRGRYRWIEGEPQWSELPLRPSFVHDQLRPATRAATLTRAQFREWTRSLPVGPPCTAVRHRFARAVEAVWVPGGSRHNAVLPHVLALVRLGEQEHTGVPAAVRALRDQFVRAVADRAHGDDARREFDRMAGPRAVGIVAAEPTPEEARVCVCPEGLLTLIVESDNPIETAVGNGWAVPSLLARIDAVEVRSHYTALLRPLIEVTG